MSIELAIQNGPMVQVFDENKHLLFMQYGTLKAYSSESVTIIRDKERYVFNEKQELIDF